MNVSESTQLRPWRLVLVLFVVLFFAFAPSAYAGGFPRLVIFGDSLSDAGNHFIATGDISLPPFDPIPDASYAIGGHHFSNGATWAEQLAQGLGLPTSGSPALRAPGTFTNYAVGRARARAGGGFPLFHLTTQVGLFLSDFGGNASSENLYVIWIGANDLEDALDALPSDPSPIIGAAITATANNIVALYGSGARTFLIPNLPNSANTPAVRAAGPVAQFFATLLTNTYNGALDQTLTSLQGLLPGINIVPLDVDGLFTEILAMPQAFGLTDVVDSCLTFDVTGNAICSTANRHLFWDGIHPTTAGHAILADAARQAIDP